MLAPDRELVMPVANMLEAAARAGVRADEWRAQDQPAAPRPAGADLYPAVDGGPGSGAHGVDPAPVRTRRRRRHTRLGPFAGARPGRRPGHVRSQRVAPLRLQGGGQQRLPGRGAADLRARALAAVTELGRLPAPPG